MIDSVSRLIDMALAEDISVGDITTDYLVPPDMAGTGVIVAKEDLVLAGLDVALQVFQRLDPQIRMDSTFKDGDAVSRGETILEIRGRLDALLSGERTALNFLQRLSGIATHVHSYVTALKAYPVKLVDTRKTTPGWRVLEKYAVRMGGAGNHRMGLFDGILIKDNHIAVCSGIRQAVHAARKRMSHFMKIEVEVSDLNGVSEALDLGVDIIMLDNMDVPQIREAVSLIQGRTLIEVSGGVTLKNLASLAETGVGIISVGALTHAARSVDISMRIEQDIFEITDT